MNFRDLKAAINAAPLHDLADTDAIAVCVEGNDLAIEFDDSHYLERIEELEDDVKRYGESEKTLEARVAELEKERDELEDIVRSVRTEGAAQTLAYFEQLAKDNHARAEREAQTARELRVAMDAANAECRELRRRKGISCAIVRYASEVRGLLYFLATGTGGDVRPHREDAKKLLAKLNA